MDNAEIISKTYLFSMVKKRDIKRLAKMAQSQVFRKGEVIIKEGERDARVFILVQGDVDVVIGLGTPQEKVIGHFGPDSCFGEMAVLDDHVRTASIVAVRDTQVLSLNQLNLREEIFKNPSIAIELIQSLSRRLREVHEMMI